MLFWVVAAVAVAFVARFFAVARQEDRDAALMRGGPADSDDGHPSAPPRLVVESSAIAARSGTRPLGVATPAAGAPTLAAYSTERVVPLGALTARPVQPADRMQRVASGGGGSAHQHQQLADRAPRAADETR